MSEVISTAIDFVDPSPSIEGEEIVPAPSLFNNDEFQKRVQVVMEAIKDEEKHRRCLAEIHTYLSMFDEGFRGFSQEMMMGGGPFAMLKKMMGRG